MTHDEDFETALTKTGIRDFFRLPRKSKNATKITANATSTGSENGMFSGANSFCIMAIHWPGRGVAVCAISLEHTSYR